MTSRGDIKQEIRTENAGKSSSWQGILKKSAHISDFRAGEKGEVAESDITDERCRYDCPLRNREAALLRPPEITSSA